MSDQYRLHDAVDFEEIERTYAPPPEYFDENDGFFYASREEIRDSKEERFLWKVEQAWDVPFYRRRWEEAGITPDDITSLDDIGKLPIYTVDDIRNSLESNPPYGDYQGAHLHDAEEAPLRLFTSGGTTGDPRPQIYTAREREIMAIAIARAYWIQGIHPGDVIQNAWEFSTHNAAWLYDRAMHHWLGVTAVNTSTGNVTPSTQQIKHATRWDVNSIFAFPPYLLHLAEVAEDEGYDLEEDFSFSSLPTYGPQAERDAVEKRWGVPTYNNYGFHEVGNVAFECREQAGMHIFEDLFVVQIVDPETGEEVEPGEKGELVITELFKTGAPQVRYNIKDLSVRNEEPCDCGSHLHRLMDFLGRADNMVKVRGVNVWPEAVGRIIAGHTDVTGEYFVVADRSESMATEMTALIERREDVLESGSLRSELAGMLQSELGVRINIEICDPGSLAELTELGKNPKIKRFEDRRE